MTVYNKQGVSQQAWPGRCVLHGLVLLQEHLQAACQRVL
jgi:hypothetical protein